MDDLKNFATVIQNLEQGTWTYEQRSNDTWLDRHLHTDFIEIGRSGKRYTRADFFPAQIDYFEATIPLPELKVHPLHSQSALSTYVSIFKQGTQDEYAHRSSIWVFDDNRWQLLYHQGTAFTP